MFTSLFRYLILILFAFNCVFAHKKVTTLLFNATKLLGCNHRYPDIVNHITSIDVFQNEPVTNIASQPVPESRGIPDDEPDLNIIRNHFAQALANERHDSNLAAKLKARDYITGVLVEILGNESVTLQPFILSGESYEHFFDSNDKKGTNIIGVLKGERYGQTNDAVFIIGAHWDTVKGCPGVDDNGSGVVAVLEMARLLKAKSRYLKLPFTYYFVLFDFEEYGLIGSYVYVATSIIPNVEDCVHTVFGFYNFDMVLNYNSTNNSQLMERNITTVDFPDKSLVNANPELAQEVVDTGSQGDFITVLSRNDYDEPLSTAINIAFKMFIPPIPLKLYNFQAPLEETTFQRARNTIVKYRLFFRSDHRNFWYPWYGNKTSNNRWQYQFNAYNATFRAVQFTDSGSLRGLQQECYHKACDDASQLTDDNLNFLASVVKTAYISLDIMMNNYAGTGITIWVIAAIIVSIILAALIAIIFICCLCKITMKYEK